MLNGHWRVVNSNGQFGWSTAWVGSTRVVNSVGHLVWSSQLERSTRLVNSPGRVNSVSQLVWSTRRHDQRFVPFSGPSSRPDPPGRHHLKVTLLDGQATLYSNRHQRMQVRED